MDEREEGESSKVIEWGEIERERERESKKESKNTE